MSDILPILFHRGLSYDARSALLDVGFLKTAKNIVFRKNGRTSLRPKFGAVNPTAVNAIHSIRRFKNILIIGDSTYLRFRPILTAGDFTSMGAAFGSDAFWWEEYKKFLHGVNGSSNVLIDENGNCYPGQIANPASAPSGADSGTAGNPNGHYMLYVSYLITWPNGQTYETGISSASADVNVTNKSIAWTNIPICPYVAYHGMAPSIYRKLYRGPGTGGTLGDLYYVAQIANNTATTYTDDFTDAQLAANGACGVDEYDVVPSDAKFVCMNYGRFFYVSAANPHRLYHSDVVGGADAAENETLMPLSVGVSNWDDIRTSGVGNVDPQGLVTWGTYIYIPLKQTWIRKEGNTPSTWSYKKTWANMGISAPLTMVKCPNPIGILGVSLIGDTPSLSLFNGQTSQRVGEHQLHEIFEKDLNASSIVKCRAGWDGQHYHLFYPSAANTEPDKHVAIDLSRYSAGDIRIARWEGLNSRCIDVYSQGSGIYIGGSDGIVRQNSGSESIDIDIETHDLVGKDVSVANRSKTIKNLKYNLNTGGNNVELRFVFDGDIKKWIDTGEEFTNISGNKDAVQWFQSLPNNFEGYLFSLRITGTGLAVFDLYSPWAVEYDVK